MAMSLKSKEAFKYYCSLGPNRSLYSVAKKFGISQSTVRNWSIKDKWDEACKNLDNSNNILSNVTVVDNKKDINIDDESIRTFKSYRKIINASVIEYLNNLKDGKIKITKPKDLENLINVDVLLYDKIQEYYKNKTVNNDNSDITLEISIDGDKDEG